MSFSVAWAFHPKIRFSGFQCAQHKLRLAFFFLRTLVCFMHSRGSMSGLGNQLNILTLQPIHSTGTHLCYQQNSFYLFFSDSLPHEFFTGSRVDADESAVDCLRLSPLFFFYSRQKLDSLMCKFSSCVRKKEEKIGL